MTLGIGVDLFHALVMIGWVVGLPLLFVKRWPHARLIYAIYAVAFIVVSQASMLILGECFLTVVTRWCWSQDATHVVSDDWFTVRLARTIFGLAPSHHLISRLSEALVLLTAGGVLLSLFHLHQHHTRRSRSL